MATEITLGAVLFGSSADPIEDDVTDLILIITLPVNAAVGAGAGARIGLAWREERWRVLPFGSASSDGRLRPGLTIACRL